MQFEKLTRCAIPVYSLGGELQSQTKTVPQFSKALSPQSHPVPQPSQGSSPSPVQSRSSCVGAHSSHREKSRHSVRLFCHSEGLAVFTE